METIIPEKYSTFAEQLASKAVNFLPKLLGAILILFIGWWIIKLINRLVKSFYNKKDYDVTLERFSEDLIRWALYIILFVLVITQLGVESASLIAVIGSAGLAVGLALQGSLANFAGGVLILVLRPFKVGDWISAQDVDGAVDEISILNTKLITFGNQEVYVPNGKLANGNITNFTVKGVRREAMTWEISYNSNIKLAKNILLDLINEQEKVLKDPHPEPAIMVTELAENSVNLSLRYWAKNEDFFTIRFYMLEEGKKRLEEAGISIPFPQREIHHVYKADEKILD